jgi:hypothetical protein
MLSMDIPISKAYISPENYDEPIRYSGHVERPDGSLEFSPVFSELLTAVVWARERTDFVLARGGLRRVSVVRRWSKTTRCRGS